MIKRGEMQNNEDCSLLLEPKYGFQGNKYFKIPKLLLWVCAKISQALR